MTNLKMFLFLTNLVFADFRLFFMAAFLSFSFFPFFKVTAHEECHDPKDGDEPGKERGKNTIVDHIVIVIAPY